MAISEEVFKSTVMISDVIISDAVTKSGSLPSLTHFLTMSLSETTPSNIFCSFSIGTAVPILNEQKILLGVVSERDIVRKCVKDGRDPDLVTASDIMTSEIITVDLKTSSEIAIKIMGENNIRHLPVVDDQNKLINFISHRDLISSVRDSTKLNIILITFICMIIPIVFLVKSFGWI